MKRRKFLYAIGALLGACGLTCAGSTLLLSGEDRPAEPLPLGFPNLTLEGQAGAKRVLVAYASESGSTGGVAEAIGRSLNAAGAAVDVRPVKAAGSLEAYQAVVLGSAIHGGKWLPEAVDFLEANQQRLRETPTAFFLVCMMAASSSAATKDLVAQFLADQRALVEPAAEGRFAGALFPKKYGLGTNIGLRFFLAYCGVGLRGGDYRSGGAVREWAQGVYPRLVGEGKE